MAAIASEYLADMIEPDKFAAAIFGVTLSFTLLGANAVGLRIWFRLRDGAFARRDDDYLMYAAAVVNIVHNALVMHGTFVGIGSPDDKLNAELMEQGRKYLFLWQIMYTINLVFIKTSILTTLKHVDKQRRFVYLIWGLIAVVSLLCIAGVITLLAKCRPLTANWTGEIDGGGGGGACMDADVFVALSKTAYVFDVLSDLAMASISTMLLWTPEMTFKAKALTGVCLGLGVVASVASVIRTVYTDAYSSEDNYLYNTGKIVLWTVVECGLGIIAGCLPMIKFSRRKSRQEERAEDKALELEVQESHDFRRAVAEAAGRRH